MSELSLEKTSEKKRGWLLPLLLVVLVAAVAVAALALSGAFSGAATGADTPDSPQALWESQDVDHYRYTLYVGCFCIVDVTRPVTIEVVDGEVASITYVEDGTAADPALFEPYTSIDKIFGIINEAESQDPVKLDVSYEESYGVPLSVDIDISEQIADEELYLEISNFEALR